MYLRNCRKAGVEVSVTGAYTLYRGAHCVLHRGIWKAVHEATQKQSGTSCFTWPGVLRYNATDMQIAELPLAMSHDRSSC